MGTGSFPGVKSGRGVTLTPPPLLVPWSWKCGAVPLLPLWAVRPVQSLSACTRGALYLTFVYLNGHYILPRIPALLEDEPSFKGILRAQKTGDHICFYLLVNDDQQGTTIIWLIYLFLISSTCFGRCFRPSSEALDCIYSFWIPPHPWHQPGATLVDNIRRCKYSKCSWWWAKTLAETCSAD